LAFRNRSFVALILIAVFVLGSVLALLDPTIPEVEANANESTSDGVYSDTEEEAVLNAVYETEKIVILTGRAGFDLLFSIGRDLAAYLFERSCAFWGCWRRAAATRRRPGKRLPEGTRRWRRAILMPLPAPTRRPSG